MFVRDRFPLKMRHPGHGIVLDTWPNHPGLQDHVLSILVRLDTSQSSDIGGVTNRPFFLVFCRPVGEQPALDMTKTGALAISRPYNAEPFLDRQLSLLFHSPSKASDSISLFFGVVPEPETLARV